VGCDIVAGKFEKQKGTNIVKNVGLLLLAIALMLGMYFLGAITTNKPRTDSKEETIPEKRYLEETETPTEDHTINAKGFFHENEELTPYLDMLGYYIVDGNVSASDEFVDNLTSVDVMGMEGSIEHKYTIHDDAPMFIDSMIWTTNETYTEETFDEFVPAMDSYFGFFAARDKDINRSNETYIWLDFSRSCRVLGWYADEKIHLQWEYDERISEMPNEPVDSKYLSLLPDFLNDELCRFLAYFDLTYAETGFSVNHASNTMNTRYPVGKCSFLGEECYVYVWYSEKLLDSGMGTATDISISISGEFEEIKERIIAATRGTIETDHGDLGFGMKIPNTDLEMYVSFGAISSADIYISRNDESNEEKVQPTVKESPQESASTKPNDSTAINSARHTDSEAWSCAKAIVEDNLKSPSTAKFCSFTEASVRHIGNGEYMVVGWVDAQNGFGATVREDFVVTYTATASGYRNGSVIFS